MVKFPLEKQGSLQLPALQTSAGTACLLFPGERHSWARGEQNFQGSPWWREGDRHSPLPQPAPALDQVSSLLHLCKPSGMWPCDSCPGLPPTLKTPAPFLTRTRASSSLTLRFYSRPYLSSSLVILNTKPKFSLVLKALPRVFITIRIKPKPLIPRGGEGAAAPCALATQASVGFRDISLPTGPRANQVLSYLGAFVLTLFSVSFLDSSFLGFPFLS